MQGRCHDLGDTWADPERDTRKVTLAPTRVMREMKRMNLELLDLQCSP